MAIVPTERVVREAVLRGFAELCEERLGQLAAQYSALFEEFGLQMPSIHLAMEQFIVGADERNLEKVVEAHLVQKMLKILDRMSGLVERTKSEEEEIVCQQIGEQLILDSSNISVKILKALEDILVKAEEYSELLANECELMVRHNEEARRAVEDATKRFEEIKRGPLAELSRIAFLARAARETFEREEMEEDAARSELKALRERMSPCLAGLNRLRQSIAEAKETIEVRLTTVKSINDAKAGRDTLLAKWTRWVELLSSAGIDLDFMSGKKIAMVESMKAKLREANALVFQSFNPPFSENLETIEEHARVEICQLETSIEARLSEGKTFDGTDGRMKQLLLMMFGACDTERSINGRTIKRMVAYLRLAGAIREDEEEICTLLAEDLVSAGWLELNTTPRMKNTGRVFYFVSVKARSLIDKWQAEEPEIRDRFARIRLEADREERWLREKKVTPANAT